MISKAPRLKPLFCACAIACCIGSAPAAFAKQQLIDRVSVLVDGSAITESELRQATAQLRASNPGAPLEELRKAATEELIMVTLQEQEARRLGLSVDNATLDRAVASVAAQNGANLTTFRRQVEGSGLPWKEFRKSIERQILLERLREREITRRINISAQEVDDYLADQDATDGQKEYELEHFVIALPPTVDAKARARAERAVNQLLTELDRKRSATAILRTLRGQQVPINGGPLGWRTVASLPPPMDKIVPKLTTGKFSDPVVDAQGVHVLRVLGVRTNTTDTVAQTRARHILLKLNPLRDAETAKTELNALREQIENGASFDALAEEFSEDYGSGVLGGDLGWFGPGTMTPAFEKELQRMSPDQVSAPFETPFGWHIVKLEERKQAPASKLERRNKARAAIGSSKQVETTKRWLQQLRDQAFLEYPSADQ